jgi:N-acylneuraminate cytidylyltransferase
MRIAVIPARGGSKRIPKKNIKLFCGKPIIAWSIEAALQSGCFDKVVVSTDNASIAEVAEKAGASVPFIRPTDLSDDYVGTIPVISHAVEWFQFNGFDVDWVCCIYATAPFIRTSDIQTGLEAIKDTTADYAFTVTNCSYSFHRALRINVAGRVEMFFPEHFNTRSQDLEEAYHDAGQFYWGCATAWLEEKPVFSSETIPIFIPADRVQDIDTPEDWRRAEQMFQCTL